MLIEFRVSNFRSFHEEQVLSMIAGSGDELPGNCMEVSGNKLLRTGAIYGPNASGKSNLIDALGFMVALIKKSTEMEGAKAFRHSPFLLDDESREKPSVLEVTFLVGEVRYQYGFSVGKGQIHDEWLIAYPKGRPQRWFERSLDLETNEYTWRWSSFFKGPRDRLKEMTRSTTLFLSAGALLNHPQLVPIHNWLTENVRVLPSGAALRPVTAAYLEKAAGIDTPMKGFRAVALDLLRRADLGIADVKVKTCEVPRADEFVAITATVPEERREAMLAEITAELADKYKYDIEMRHRNARTGIEASLALDDESSGTQRFFELIGPWIEAVFHGYVVVVDELERSLHPLLVRELVEFFQNPGLSQHQAQLIFATHDTTLLDPELLRRNQVWFTEKDGEGATRLYSLYEYKEHRARKGEAMQKGYLAGRYGAIPVLERFSLGDVNGG